MLLCAFGFRTQCGQFLKTGRACMSRAEEMPSVCVKLLYCWDIHIRYLDYVFAIEQSDSAGICVLYIMFLNRFHQLFHLTKSFFT